MKKMMKYALLLAFAGMALTGCTVWEDQCTECIPLPETKPEINPDPWEPSGTEENPVGN